MEAEAGPGHDKVGAAQLEVLLLIDAPADVLRLCRHAFPSSRCLIYPPLLSLQKEKLCHCPDHAWIYDLLKFPNRTAWIALLPQAILKPEAASHYM